MGIANVCGRIETEEQYEQRLSRYYRRLAADRKSAAQDRDLPRFTNQQLDQFMSELKLLVQTSTAPKVKAA